MILHPFNDINMNLTRMEKSPGVNYTEEDFVSVWPYAIYYPYYEQYITMTEDAVFQIGICLIPGWFHSYYNFKVRIKDILETLN